MRIPIATVEARAGVPNSGEDANDVASIGQQEAEEDVDLEAQRPQVFQYPAISKLDSRFNP